LEPLLLTSSSFPSLQEKSLMETSPQAARGVNLESPTPLSTLSRTDSDVLSRLSTALRPPIPFGEKQIAYFDQQTRLYWHARQETVFSTNILYTYVIRHLDDLCLLLTHSLQQKLHLYLYETICRTALLAGVLLYDMGQYEVARQQYQMALQAATEANNSILQAIVWGWTSFTWTYAHSYKAALRCIQQARFLATQTPNRVVRAWLGAVEAEIQAHLYNSDACLQSLSDMEKGFDISPSQDILYLFEFHPALLLGYKGICLQQLYQREKPETHRFLQEAQASLELALASEAPLKRKLYYLSDLAAIYARKGEIENACSYVSESLPLITQIGNGSKTIHQHLLQVRALLQPYEDTLIIQQLDEQMAPFFLWAGKEDLAPFS
jgi:hypothetical protein